MIPATVASAHSINTLDRIAFCKSVREKRKQLQLNHQNDGESNDLFSYKIKEEFFSHLEKEDLSSSTENAFLTQMLQSASPSMISSSVSSSLSIPSLLRKGNLSLSPSPSSSHRTATSTLTNILPALLNGTMQSPRAISPSSTLSNVVTLNSPTSTSTTDTLVDIKCSTSLPVSPAPHTFNTNQSGSVQADSTNQSNSSPPRCRSYPMAALTKRSSPPTSAISPTDTTPNTQSFPSPTTYLLATTTSHSLLTNTATTTSMNIPATSPSPDETTPKIVRSASVKSCASDSGVSSSSPLSDNNIVHVSTSLNQDKTIFSPYICSLFQVFRTNQIETNNQPSKSLNGSRKRKSLAHFYEELNKDKKFSSESTMSSTFPMSTSTTNTNIPYSQQEALAIGYAQYALMHTLSQQFRVNYPAALLHAAAASAYLPLSSPMMAAAVAAATSANASTNGTKTSTNEKFRERQKGPIQMDSDNNNNHIPSNTSLNDQPYRRETYQTLLESSRLLGHHQQQKLLKPVPIDLRKHNGTSDSSKYHFFPHLTISISNSSRSSSIKFSLFIIFIFFGITSEFSSLFKSTEIEQFRSNK